jgi:hypothetical protein
MKNNRINGSASNLEKVQFCTGRNPSFKKNLVFHVGRLSNDQAL